MHYEQNVLTTENFTQNNTLALPALFYGSETALTFKSLAVSLRTTRFNNQNFYMVLALR
jgi:hypothetical protein